MSLHPDAVESFGVVTAPSGIPPQTTTHYADRTSRPTPEERHTALAELTELIMAERKAKHDEVMERFRATFRPPAGEWKSKKWIVILSDDERVRKQVTAILEGERFFVKSFELSDAAMHAMDAAFYLEDGKVPNLIATDAFSKEIGRDVQCLEFYRELRQRTAYADVPVVMFVRGNDMPAVPFIFSVSEPIDAAALLEFIHRECA